jgi:hypothetical protein
MCVSSHFTVFDVIFSLDITFVNSLYIHTLHPTGTPCKISVYFTDEYTMIVNISQAARFTVEISYDRSYPKSTLSLASARTSHTTPSRLRRPILVNDHKRKMPVMFAQFLPKSECVYIFYKKSQI